jgi:hypothetical protein
MPESMLSTLTTWFPMVLAEALHVRARLVVECFLDPVSKELVEALQLPARARSPV